jgi:hypothetical protein
MSFFPARFLRNILLLSLSIAVLGISYYSPAQSWFPIRESAVA